MLPIGAFARQGGVTPRMLRHYDRIGLLCPAATGENGYRYYDEAQLATLARVEELKRYGFSLAQVAQLLPLPAGEVAKRIHARRLDAYRQLNELRRTLRQMESEIIQMEGTKAMSDNYHIIEMAQPEQTIFGLRKTINVSETHALFQQLYSEMEARGITRTGATQLVYMGDENFDYDHMDVEAQCMVAPGGDGVKTMPAGLFLATTHTGPYESVKYAYEALGAYIKSHPEYTVTGPGIERYIKDEGMAQSPEELETAVLFPVSKNA